MILPILGLGVASFVISWLPTAIMIRLAPRLGLVDKPGGRKIHAAPKPNLPPPAPPPRRGGKPGRPKTPPPPKAAGGGGAHPAALGAPAGGGAGGRAVSYPAAD